MFRCLVVRKVPSRSITNSMTVPIQRSLLVSKKREMDVHPDVADCQSQLPNNTKPALCQLDPFTLLPRFEGCLRGSCCRLLVQKLGVFRQLDYRDKMHLPDFYRSIEWHRIQELKSFDMQFRSEVEIRNWMYLVWALGSLPFRDSIC